MKPSMCGGASTTVGPSVFRSRWADGVDGLGVGGQQHRPGVHQVFPDHDLLGLLRAEGPQALAQGDLAHRHHLGHVDLDRAIELLQIEQSFGGVADRIAVLELEIAEAGLQRLGAEPSVGLRLLRNDRADLPGCCSKSDQSAECSNWLHGNPPMCFEGYSYPISIPANRVAAVRELATFPIRSIMEPDKPRTANIRRNCPSR